MTKKEAAANTPDKPTTDLRCNGGAGVGWTILFPVVVAAILTTAVYYLVAPQNAWVEHLVAHRGLFQHVNIFLFWFGVATIVAIILRCQREAGAVDAGQNVMSKAIARWNADIHDQMSASGSQLVRAQRDQGKEILQSLLDSGVAQGQLERPRLEPGHDNILCRRILRIAVYLRNTRAQNLVEAMDMNRDLSSLDHEQLTGRFTFVRYIVYVMPVIGFLGTVWGIGAALGAISETLPSIKDLDGFVHSLGFATDALQVAFDTTLLALALSGVLTLFLTVGTNRGEGLLVSIDTWIIENVLSHITEHNPMEQALRVGFAQQLDKSEQIRKTVNQGFYSVIGKKDDKLYQGGLGELHATMRDLQSVSTEVRDSANELVRVTKEDPASWGIHQSLNKIAETNERILESSEFEGAELQRLRSDIQTLPGAANTLVEVRDAMNQAVEICDKLQGHQESVSREIHDLAEAVQKVPQSAESLKEAADKLVVLARDLEGLGDLIHGLQAGVSCLPEIRDAVTMEAPDSQDTSAARLTLVHVIGQLADNLTVGVRSLPEIHQALARDDGNGQPASTAIGEIMALRTALDQTFRDASHRSAEQISRAVDGVEAAITVLEGPLSTLNTNFLKLRQALLKHLDDQDSGRGSSLAGDQGGES